MQTQKRIIQIPIINIFIPFLLVSPNFASSSSSQLEVFVKPIEKLNYKVLLRCIEHGNHKELAIGFQKGANLMPTSGAILEYEQKLLGSCFWGKALIHVAKEEDKLNKGHDGYATLRQFMIRTVEISKIDILVIDLTSQLMNDNGLSTNTLHLSISPQPWSYYSLLVYCNVRVKGDGKRPKREMIFFGESDTWQRADRVQLEISNLDELKNCEHSMVHIDIANNSSHTKTKAWTKNEFMGFLQNGIEKICFDNLKVKDEIFEYKNPICSKHLVDPTLKALLDNQTRI